MKLPGWLTFSTKVPEKQKRPSLDDIRAIEQAALQQALERRQRLAEQVFDQMLADITAGKFMVEDGAMQVSVNASQWLDCDRDYLRYLIEDYGFEIVVPTQSYTYTLRVREPSP